MIRKIVVGGLRGKSFDLKLNPITLVIGANTAGKTTVADAIRWGLLGYIPGMHAPPRGWAELLGNGAVAAEVHLHLADSMVVRSMRLEGAGNLRIDGPGSEWKAPVNVLTLDPARFLEATGPKRAQMVADATKSAFDWRALVPVHLRGPSFQSNGAWPLWIDQALNEAKTTRSILANDKKTLIATLRGLEELRGVVIGDDAAIKAKLDQHKEGMGALKAQLKAVNQQIVKVKEPPPNSAERQLDTIRRGLQEFLGQEHDAETYSERLADYHKRWKKQEQAEHGQPVDVDGLRLAVQQEESDVQLQTSRLWQLAEHAKSIKAKYAELRKHKKCPTCGTGGKVLTAALKAAESQELANIEVSINEAEMMRQAAEERLEELVDKLEQAERFEQQRVALEAELAQLKAESQLIKLWAEHDRLLELVKAESQTYDMEALETRQYDIQCELEDAQQSAAEWEQELQEINYKRSQKKQLAEIERKLAEAEAGWQTENQNVHELEILRTRLIAMSMDPILKTLGMFTKGIFAEPLSLEGTELGRMIGSRWVPLGQFSGSEQAVAIAGLCCALQGDPKRGNLVLADELSSFDDEHLLVFLKNVAQAVEAGVLDQFIGFSTPRKNLLKAVPKAVKVVMI